MLHDNRQYMICATSCGGVKQGKMEIAVQELRSGSITWMQATSRLSGSMQILVLQTVPASVPSSRFACRSVETPLQAWPLWLLLSQVQQVMLPAMPKVRTVQGQVLADALALSSSSLWASRSASTLSGAGCVKGGFAVCIDALTGGICRLYCKALSIAGLGGCRPQPFSASHLSAMRASPGQQPSVSPWPTGGSTGQLFNKCWLK